MKKLILSVLICLISLTSSIYLSACDKCQYSLNSGSYEFEKAVFINKGNNEITTNYADDIIENKNDFLQWNNLLSFSIFINENTEYFKNGNNDYFVVNEGLAFKIIADDTLQLHFPYWRSYDYGNYDITITLTLKVLYG